ncbi:MAG TPA: PilT/PilU family type 4a pilus ATPase, partial [Fimbriimonadaceae bacterium]|nr:PilT/PilU family type 4a pilus ATPase [Fimbriimonadaceae bacterium]
MLRIEDLLRRCVEMDGSDLHLKTDAGKTYVRVYGDLHPLDDVAPFTEDEFKEAMSTILSPTQWEKFDKDMELDFAYEIEGVARFRGNMYLQRSHLQAAFRVIPLLIQTMEDLNLPSACYDYVERPRGLVLVTGPAGSGKSTSLAAMIDRINRTRPVHIVTVEDPLEFVHDDHLALINQRELEQDTLSFANALKFVLRQDPDVILVGEMRDLETISTALLAAETGHLVLSTLHTLDATETIQRIIAVFPPPEQKQIRLQLASTLKAVISQRLVRKGDGQGRVPAAEVMIATGYIRDCIMNPDK